MSPKKFSWRLFEALMLSFIVSITSSETSDHYESSQIFQNMRKKPSKNAPFQMNVQNPPKMSFANTTCHFFHQPLDHFALGAHDADQNISTKLEQRYCVYEDFQNSDNAADDPIFFYTGNESPVETYANHTGLMWSLGPKYKALLVFAEHRYEGESLPMAIKNPKEDLDGDFPNCMSYVSSSQALADYARLLSYLNPGNKRPVIVFGGSYGGMLASWMRMKYPSSVAGAIASSAPVWATPLTRPSFDSANVAVARGVMNSDEKDMSDLNDRKENVVNGKKEGGYCFDNLLATWPLIEQFSKSRYGRSVLNKAFRLCPEDHLQKDKDVTKLLEWSQSPWFAMSEGNYPFESNYITFALLHFEQVKLPKWPITEACHRGGLNLFQNVKIVEALNTGNGISDVQFDVVVVNENDEEVLRLNVDWDKIKLESKSIFELYHLRESAAAGVEPLFEAVREAVGVWFNITEEKTCFTLDTAVSTTNGKQNGSRFDSTFSLHAARSLESKRVRSDPIGIKETQEKESCSVKIAKEGSWSSICCNENLNLPIYIAQGMGNDFFWPPTYPKGTTLPDVLKTYAEYDFSCYDPEGIYGYPKHSDPWSNWLDDYYGGLRIGKHSNIVFSNGLLDPWSGGGVYPGNPPPKGLYEGPVQLNITGNGSVVALLIAEGAHHLDLFFETEDDPKSVRDVRAIEDQYIGKWIHEWKEQICVGKVCEVR